MSFGHTKFGEGLVDFSFCKFRSGSLDFAYAVFNEAIVRFPSTDIGRIGVHFECAMFDKSALMFAGVGKKENALTITNATFTKSQINLPADSNTCSLNFVKAHFKNSCLDLYEINFEDCKVNFCEATFEESKLDFKNTIFDDGNINFDRMTCINSQMNFNSISFGRNKFGFDNFSLGGCTYDFEEAIFAGRANFAGLICTKEVNALSFRHASFGGAFTLGSEDTFGCVPDLVGTKTSNHTSLAGLKCVFPTKLNSFRYRQAKDKRDAERLRRLKELAKQNRDFELALYFRVKKMHADRWPKHGMPTIFAE